MALTAEVAQAVLGNGKVQSPPNMRSSTLLSLFKVFWDILFDDLLHLACLSGFISAASTLSFAPQGSVAIVSDTSTSSLISFELLSPSNQSVSWSNTSSAPIHPPSLAANTSALQALGLDTDKPISWETTPSGNVLGVQCNIRYGRRLDFLDCRDAYSYIIRSDDRVSSFAQRHSGLPHDIALPQRALGSECVLQYTTFLPFRSLPHSAGPDRQLLIRRGLGKGKCAIDSALIAPHDTARASVKNVADAAFALIERCAPRSGGIAVNIGQF
ncbi:MAG: hypothetical protein Q9161_002691 [Pseudevernia consocians]